MAISVATFEPSRNYQVDRARSRDKTSPQSASLHVSRDDTRTNIHKQVSTHKRNESTRPRLTDSTTGAEGLAAKRVLDDNQVQDDDLINALGTYQTARIGDFPPPTALLNSTHSIAALSSQSSLDISYENDDSSPNMVQGYSNNIGMALGSPSHQPVPQQQNYATPDEGAIQSRDTVEPLIDIWRDQAPLSKPKESKWRMLGGIFGKKNSKTSQAFYQLQQDTAQDSPQPGPEPFETPLAASEWIPQSSKSRTNSHREIKHKRPETKRAATVPLNFNFTKSAKSSMNTTPELRLEGGPILNVEIPDVHLERYSVMFGSVLRPAGLSSTSALLARRQATLDKLKTVNEAIAEHERHEEEAKGHLLRPRRATSPQPGRSPSFSLFPSPQIARDGPLANVKYQPSSLQRSSTFPAVLSPYRHSFAPEPSRSKTSKPEADDLVLDTDIGSRPKEEFSSSWSAGSVYLTPPTNPLPPRSNEQQDPARLRLTLKETIRDVVPEIIPDPLPTPPMSNSSTSTSGKARKAHSKQSSASTTISATSTSNTATSMPSPMNINRSLPPSSQTVASRPTRGRAHTISNTSTPMASFHSAEILSSEAAAESAASVSIARQISISQRQKRQLLVLSKPRSATVSSPSPSISTRPPLSNVATTFPSTSHVTRMSSSSLDKELPLLRQNSFSRHDDYEEPHPGQRVILPERPSTSYDRAGSNADPYFTSSAGGLQPPPSHHQLGSPSSISSLPNTTYASPTSQSSLVRKGGSVRAARLALAGVGMTEGTVVLGIDEHGMGTTMRDVPGQGGERFLVRERKPSTPTLVQVDESRNAIQNRAERLDIGHMNTMGSRAGSPAGGRGHVHRKSERAVVEHA